MAEGAMIENGFAFNGTRRARVVRMGAPVDSEWITRLVTAEALPTVQAFRWHERDVDMHHLDFVWGTREVVRLVESDFTPNPDLSPDPSPNPLDKLGGASRGEGSARGEGNETAKGVRAVMWWIGKGESLRFAIDLAATMFWMRTGREPVKALVRMLPDGAEEGMMMEVKLPDLTPALSWEEREKARKGKLKLLVEKWVPERMVVITGGDYERRDSAVAV